MKLLFDHNLSPRLPVRLDDLYPESTQTHYEGIRKFVASTKLDIYIID